jgi:hypothetical protein
MARWEFPARLKEISSSYRQARRLQHNPGGNENRGGGQKAIRLSRTLRPPSEIGSIDKKGNQQLNKGMKIKMGVSRCKREFRLTDTVKDESNYRANFHIHWKGKFFSKILCDLNRFYENFQFFIARADWPGNHAGPERLLYKRINQYYLQLYALPA